MAIQPAAVAFDMVPFNPEVHKYAVGMKAGDGVYVPLHFCSDIEQLKENYPGMEHMLDGGNDIPELKMYPLKIIDKDLKCEPIGI
jgi:hypothetical protein